VADDRGLLALEVLQDGRDVPVRLVEGVVLDPFGLATLVGVSGQR
jgi:hypothetical protein